MKKFRFQVKVKDQPYTFITPWSPSEGETLRDIGEQMENLLDGYDEWFGFVSEDGYRIVRRSDIEYLFIQEEEVV